MDTYSDKKNGVHRALDTPVHLGSLAATLDNQVEQIKSIWVTSRDDMSVSTLIHQKLCLFSSTIPIFQKVDAKKLEKAEAKLQQKQEKRIGEVHSSRQNTNSNDATLGMASASQMTSKKDNKLESKNGEGNKTQDIRIENFDIAYGDRVLLQGADLTIAFGRRYGLIGNAFPFFVHNSQKMIFC